MRSTSTALRFVALSLVCLGGAQCGGNSTMTVDGGNAGNTSGGETGPSAPTGQETILFKMESVEGVMSNPPQITTFTLTQVSYITRVWTYHYNATIGAATPTVSLKNTSTGVIFGPWPQVGYKTFAGTLGATASDPGNIPGPPDNYWMAYPLTSIPAGIYQVIDSAPATWSYTGDLGNRGVTWVYGYAGSGLPSGLIDASSGDSARIDARPSAGQDAASLDGGDASSGSFTVTIAPSSQPTTVSIGPGVSVTVPAGLLTSAQTLTVTPISSPPAPIYAGLEMGGAYDIQLGGLHSFSQELTIRIKYDPARLRTDIPVERNISAATWDTSQGIWVAMPSTVDQTTNEVVIPTKHLSLFSWLIKKAGYSVFFKNNFYLVYNKAEVTDPNFLTYYRNPDSSNYADINTPNFVEDVMAFLIEAWKVYMSDNGFTAPPAPVDVYVGTDLSPFTEKFTGVILVSLLSKTPEELKLVTGHELFHRVQNAYYADLGGMLSLTWWLESTADYAGDVVVWKGLRLMGGEGGIKRSYLEAPLADTSAQHNDGYATAYFVKYLVDQGADFKAMFTSTAAYDPSLFMLGLNAYLEGIHGTNGGLATQYRQFARSFVFDSNSPMPAISDSLHDEVASYRTTVTPNSPQTVSMSLDGGYTSKLWGIWVPDSSFNTSPANASFSISADGTLPDRVAFDVFVLKGDRRVAGGAAPVGSLAGTQKSVSVNVEKGDAIYVQGANWDNTAHTVVLKISDGATTIPPGPCHFTSGEPIGVTLTLGTTKCSNSATLSLCFTPSANGTIQKSSEPGCDEFVDSYQVSGTYSCDAVILTYSFTDSRSSDYPGCSLSSSVTRTIVYGGTIPLTWNASTSTYTFTAGSGSYSSKYESTTCSNTFPTCSSSDLQVSAAK